MSYSTKQFIYSPSSKLFIADASTLASVDSHACDEGLILISSKTRAVSVWIISQIDRDFCNNDIQCWTLVPTSETLYKHPTLINHIMKIFNR